MCWSEKVSWLSFVIGTLANSFLYYTYPNKQILAICLFWQYILFMQVAEAMIWRNKDNKECDRWSYVAMLLNITQPIAIGIIFLCLLNPPKNNKILSLIILSIYTVWVLNVINQTKVSCSKTNSCSHISYDWWETSQSFIPYFSNQIGNTILYLITVISVIYLLLSRELSLVQLAYILFTFFVSILTYGCGKGSLWCWMVVLAPIITLLTYKSRSVNSITKS